MKVASSYGHHLLHLWMGFFVVVALVGLIMSQTLAIAFGAMGLLASGISWVWERLSLEELKYERSLSHERVFKGEDVSMTVALTNNKPLPLLWVRTVDEVSEELKVIEGSVERSTYSATQTLSHSTAMAWYERIRWTYKMRCTRRGLYRIGPVQIESGDPFGFLRRRRTDQDQVQLMVYPKVYPLEQLGIPAARPLGEVRTGIQIFQDPSRPAGLREYRVGDPLKTVDWKATAKRQRLQVRTFEPSSDVTVVLVVAVDLTEPFWSGYAPEVLERVITAAASVASYASEQQYALGLFSNDMPIIDNSPMAVPPSRGREQLAAILGALAVTRAFAVAPMFDLLAEHARRFPFGATIVVATGFIPSAFVETLRYVKSRGFRVIVLYVGDEDCPALAEGIIVYELRDYLVGLERESELVAG